MSQPLVTAETVAHAAQALVRRGERVSVRRVMAELGGGSPNAVLPHLQAWRVARPSVQAAEIALDARIVAGVSAMVDAAVAAAVAEAQERAAAALEDADASSAQASELVEREAELERLAEDLNEQRATLEGVRDRQAGELERLAADLDRERQAARVAQDAAARLEARFEDLRAAHTERAAELERVRAELGQAGAAAQVQAVALAQAQAEAGALREVRADLVVRLEAATAATVAAEQRAREATAAAASADAQAKALAGELERLKQHNNGLTDRMHEQHDQLVQANAAIGRLEERERLAKQPKQSKA